MDEIPAEWYSVDHRLHGHACFFVRTEHQSDLLIVVSANSALNFCQCFYYNRQEEFYLSANDVPMLPLIFNGWNSGVMILCSPQTARTRRLLCESRARNWTNHFFSKQTVFLISDNVFIITDKSRHVFNPNFHHIMWGFLRCSLHGLVNVIK